MPFVAKTFPPVGIRFTADCHGLRNVAMKKQRGFTLIELMMTLVIATVLLTVGIPSFSQVIRTNRIASQVNMLVSSLNAARSEAVTRGVPVSVCASTDQATCSGNNDWSTGWIVYTDNNSAGATSISQVLHTYEALGGSPVVATDTGATFMRYQNDGSAGTQVNITHTIADCSGSEQRVINISAAGRVSIAASACP